MFSDSRLRQTMVPVVGFEDEECWLRLWDEPQDLGGSSFRGPPKSLLTSVIDSRRALWRLAAMFYGWRIVAVTFVTNFIAVGLVFYSYGVFFKALAAEFGGSRFGVATGLAIMNIAIGVFAPFLGHALDRRSIRNTICLGAVLMAVGFFAASQIDALWQFYAVMGTLLAVGVMAVGPLAGATLVANWFTERRGIALGVAGMGISASGFAMAPLATLLIGAIGWRDTFLVYGAVPLVVVLPLAWPVVVNRPERIGLRPDGASDPGAAAWSAGDPPAPPAASDDRHLAPAAEPNWSTRNALGQRNLWVIAIAIALNSCTNGAMLTHIIPHATDSGFDPMAAAWVLSCIAGFGAIGKLLFGWIADRIDKRLTLWCATGLQGLGIVLILNAEQYHLLLLAGVVYGLGMGGMPPLAGLLIGAAFGRYRFGRMMGLMNPLMAPIRVLGIPYAGWIFDRTGSYEIAFLTFIGLCVLSMLAVAFLRLPEVEPGTESTGPSGATGSGS
jgi:MFS family permease